MSETSETLATRLDNLTKDDQTWDSLNINQWKTAIEAVRKDCTYLNDVVEGKADISSKMEYVVEDAGGYRHYVPHYVGKETRAEIRQVESIVGDTGMAGNAANIAFNPIGLPLCFLVGYALIVTPTVLRHTEANPLSSFYYALKIVAKQTIPFLAALTFFGYLSSDSREDNQQDASANASIIQEKIEQIYHTEKPVGYSARELK